MAISPREVNDLEIFASLFNGGGGGSFRGKKMLSENFFPLRIALNRGGTHLPEKQNIIL